jgi:hypothetical protein
MRVEPVDVYSDTTNMPVLRHPDRQFPGSLIQGDDLHALCRLADEACDGTSRSEPGYRHLNELRNRLWGRLNHYKAVLDQHGIPMPFSD